MTATRPGSSGRGGTLRRFGRRRVAAVAIAAALLAADPLGFRPAAVAAPEDLPPSVGSSILFHLQLARDIDGNGFPIGQDTVFPEGTELILGLLGWTYVPAGTELKLRLFQDERFVFETAHVVNNEFGTEEGTNVGFVFPFLARSGFPAGDYAVEVDYNGVPDEVVPFEVVADGAATELPGADEGGDQILGSGTETGPIPYKDPSEVLVVTRKSVLEDQLGSRAASVFAAAARVGSFHDLDIGGIIRDTADLAADEVQRLLRAGPYKYLLILGNDDAVPYFRVDNPMAESEADILAYWELPADWVPSDNFYTDLDQDGWGVPDLPIARIPSSDDADLLLTQLSDLVPPDGSAFALVNQERRSQAAIVLGTIDDRIQVRLEYAPPAEAGEFGENADAESARYLYVLLHGIGVLTDAWSANTVAWEPMDPDDPAGDEWIVHEADQVDAVTAETDPVSQGVVQIGACYGAWTLDTIAEPVHKTSDNNLALHYLKSGSRAFVADTHISYSTAMGPEDTPRGRTGFEVLFWRAINEGMAPIDAFQAAKVGMGEAVDALVEAGDIDSARITLKTLHYMVYLGRP